RQQLKIKWMTDGDENTRHFHSIYKRQKTQNAIHGVMVGEVWTTNANAIKSATKQFSSNLFQESNQTRPRLNLTGMPQLTTEMSATLDAPIIEEEVKVAVWKGGSNKSPGPDGFTYEFLQKFWDTLKVELVAAVKFFEATGHLPRGCNPCFITLIKKVRNPSGFQDYRPISLLGIIYKII
ncbi:hypothetical protein M569_16220, partial [Genlisea aurea]